MQHDATMERTGPLPLTVQHWDRYTPEEHAVWGLLYARRMATLRDTASRVFLEGAATIGLLQDRVPDIARINARLRPLTGWCAIPVGGFPARGPVLRVPRRTPLSHHGHRPGPGVDRLRARARHFS